jgi:hypothetical protein
LNCSALFPLTSAKQSNVADKKTIPRFIGY